MVKCYKEPRLLYACETCTISRSAEKHLMASEMWFQRKMRIIPWMDRRINEAILEETDETHKIIR